jgi:uncharacterized protein YlbG (UPF0298 family)
LPTISVRISEEERKRLSRYGKLSESVREALTLYFDTKDSERLFERLEQLQRSNPVRTAPAELVKIIKEDRTR